MVMIMGGLAGWYKVVIKVQDTWVPLLVLLLV